MALLYRRPLAAAAFLLIFTAFLSYLLPMRIIFVMILTSGILCAILFSLCVKYGVSYRKFSLLLLAIALLLGASRVMLHRAERNDLTQAYSDSSVSAELIVKEVLYNSTYGAEYLVKVECINGEDKDTYAILRSEQILPFYTGDRFKGDFTVKDLGFEAYRENGEYTYLAYGAQLLLLVESTETLTLLSSGTHSFSARLCDLRTLLSARISTACEGEAGKLLGAMLLGTRESLSDTTVRDFRRIGTSHLLALSGLHLVILTGLLDRVLYHLRAGKRFRIAAVLCASLGYLVLTGCNYSMLRAVFMLSFVYLAFLLRGDHDALTGLASCAALILLITPNAIFDLSFQLTMLATLGLLIFGRMQILLNVLLPPKGGRLIRGCLSMLRFFLSSLIVSFSATLAILPVLWLTFGELSLLTPLSNLVLVPLSTPLLVLALLLLLFPVFPIAAAGGFWADAMLTIASYFSKLPCVLSLRYDFLPYLLIPFFALLVALLLSDLKKWKPLIAVPCFAAIVAFAICLAITRAAEAETLTVYYRQAGENEGLILLQNGTAVICDISNTSFSQLNADFETAKQHGATEVERLMLSHYHERAVNAIARFSDQVVVREIWAPMPATESDGDVLLSLYEMAKARDLALYVYQQEVPIEIFDGAQLCIGEPLYESRSVQAAQAISIRFGSEELCYHNAALSEYERHAALSHDCSASTLILGTHGPRPHERVELSESKALQTVLVGDEQILALLEMREGVFYHYFSEDLEFKLE